MLEGQTLQPMLIVSTLFRNLLTVNLLTGYQLVLMGSYADIKTISYC
jgi:hypothetical protein